MICGCNLYEPFLCLPLAVDARWLPTRLDRPEPTSDPKEKVGGATFVVHSMGKRKRWSRGSVWWRTMWEWRMSILPPSGVSEPLVGLPSALATGLARWPSWASGTHGRPKERVGWWIVGWTGVEDRRGNNTTEGETLGEAGSADQLSCLRPCCCAVAMLVAIPVVPVLSSSCLVLSMWPSHPPKSKNRQKPVENGLCGVS